MPVSREYLEGVDAYWERKRPDDCPYAPNNHPGDKVRKRMRRERVLWMRGWFDAWRVVTYGATDGWDRYCERYVGDLMLRETVQ